MTGINPLDFSKLADLGVSQGTTDRYQGQWEEFVRFSQISELRAPVEEDFELYFKKRRAEGLSGNTLGPLHSALSSMMTHFYNKSLSVSLQFLLNHLLVNLRSVCVVYTSSICIDSSTHHHELLSLSFIIAKILH